MSEEQAAPVPYRLTRYGVELTVNGQPVAPGGYGWDAYQAWLRAGGKPLPMLADVVVRSVDLTEAGRLRAAREFSKLSKEEAIAVLLKRSGHVVKN